MKLGNIFNSKHIRVAAIGSLGIKFFSAFFIFLTGLILARALGLEGFGIYTIAFATVTLLTVPISLGLPNLITRYISKYEFENNNAAIKGLFYKSNQIAIAATIIIYLLAFLSYYLWWKNLDPMLVETLWYSFFLAPLIALSSLRAAALRGLRFIILGQLPDTLIRNFLLCLVLAIFYFSEIALTPVIAVKIHIIAASISLIIGHLFLRSKLLNSLKDITPVFHNKEWLKQAIPFSLNGGVQVIKNKLITYILAGFGSIEAVAIFDIAIRGATLVAFTLDALNTAIAPYISNAFEKNDMAALQNIVTKTSRIIFIFAVPVVLIFLFGGESLLIFLFGKEYAASYVPLVILCVGQLVNAAAGSVGLVLNMTGRQLYFTKVTSFVTILNLILSFPLVIYFDVIGAAIIVSGLLVLQNVILVFYVNNKLKVNTTIF